MKLLKFVALIVLSAPLLGSSWEKVFDDKGLQVFKQKSNDEILTFRAYAELDVGFEQVAKVLVESNKFPEWKERALDAKILKHVNQSSRIEYHLMDAPLWVKNRHFVLKTQCRRPNPSVYQLNFESVAFNGVPDTGSIEGKIHDGLYELKKNGKGTSLVFQAKVNPQGWIPAWLVNFIQKHYAIKVIQALEVRAKALPKKGKPPHDLCPLAESLVKHPS